MINEKEFAALAANLQNMLALFQQMSAQERNRTFFAKLFAPGGAAKLHELSDALKEYTSSDPASVKAVNDIIATIGGNGVAFSSGELDALYEFFWGDYYAPIKPVDSGQDAGFREFYEKVLSTDSGISSLKDLQTKLGVYWRKGADPTIDDVLVMLQHVTPSLHWDARHVFSLLSLLMIDNQMKQLAPYQVDPSIW